MVRDERRAAAYHESGHAVVAVEVYGYGRVERVWLEDAEDFTGGIAITRWDYIPPVWYWRSGAPVRRRISETTEHLVWAHGVYCYAGAVALARCLDDLDYGLASAQDDIWQLCHRVRESLGIEMPFPEPESGDFEIDPHGFFLWGADALVDLQWRAVEAVSEQLLARGALEGREVDEIVRSMVGDDEHGVHGHELLRDWLKNHGRVEDAAPVATM